MYTCAICGKTYESVDERVTCETKCVIERNRAEEEKKRNEIEVSRNKSEDAINEALCDVNKMLAEHLNKYGNFQINRNYPYLKYVFSRTTWWS